MFKKLLTQTSVRDMMNTERGDSMREIVKSKIMMGFIIFVLGFTYVDSMNVKRMEQTDKGVTEELVVMNEM